MAARKTLSRCVARTGAGLVNGSGRSQCADALVVTCPGRAGAGKTVNLVDSSASLPESGSEVQKSA